MKVAPQISFRLQKQQAFTFASRATEQLYGGAAGGGKSHLIRVALILWCLEIPGLQCYLFRRTFPELKQNHLEGPTSFPVLLAPIVNQGKCRIVGNEVRFANGARIYLRHCQHDKDVYNYQGAEFHVLAIDELTHWPESMFRYLRGRCRVAGLKIPEKWRGLFPRIICGTNPGNIGHHWVKSGWIDPATAHASAGHGVSTIWRTPKQEGGFLRQFIPARLEDNPALHKSDADYETRLEGLGDPLLVRALKEGDWDVVAGAMFGGAWRRPRHVCAPFPLPSTWKLWRGADDGFASPAACYWLTRDPDAGTIYVVRELYRAGMLPHDYAERIHKGDQAIELQDGAADPYLNTRRLTGIMDAAAFADTGQSSSGAKEPSRGEQMNRAGCGWSPCVKGPGSRIHRVQDFHRLLAPNPKDPKGRPGIIFFDTCVNAIRTIPTLPRDPHDTEDVDTEAEDHAFDGVTYGLQGTGVARQKMKVRGA